MGLIRNNFQPLKVFFVTQFGDDKLCPGGLNHRPSRSGVRRAELEFVEKSLSILAISCHSILTVPIESVLSFRMPPSSCLISPVSLSPLYKVTISVLGWAMAFGLAGTGQ